MATHARQQYFADENSLSKERREFSIADEIQEKIDSVEEWAQVNRIETVKVNWTALTPDANKAVNVEVPDVIDNLYTVAADDALSAKQWKILYDYIQNLQTIGRFLSNWDTATWLPITNPSESPYQYKAWDYYRVSNVAASPATNYKPDGSSYTIWAASTTVETLAVAVSDLYLYDGTDWILLSNSWSSIAVDSSLSTTSTNPVENRVVTNAINWKQETLIAWSNIQIASDWKTISATDTTYTAGTGINIDANNVISNTQTSAEWWNITWILSNQTDLQNALNNKANKIDVLEKTNTTSYIPSGDYNPATKKYVDDSISAISVWDVLVSDQANNIFTPWMKIWGGTESDYQSLTPDSNTAYLLLANQPTPPSPWRQPWVNTVLYVPMDTDLLDHWPNNISLTNTNVTISNVGWVDAGLFPTIDAYYNLSVDLSSYISSGDFTVLVWVNALELPTWSNPTPFTSIRWGFATSPYRWTSMTLSTGWFVIGVEWWQVQSSIIPTLNTWCLICWVYKTNEWILYINWNQEATSSWTLSYGFQNFGIWMDWGDDEWKRRHRRWYMSNFIIENKVWTSQEIQDYYDQTKWDYWIS